MVAATQTYRKQTITINKIMGKEIACVQHATVISNICRFIPYCSLPMPNVNILFSKRRADEQFCNDRVRAEEKSNDVSVEGLVNSDASANLQCDEQKKTKGNFCVHSQKYSEAPSFPRYGHSTIEDNQYVEDISPSTTSTLNELQTPSSRGDNLREEDNQSINGSWEERGLWISSLGWPAPIDTMSPDSWHQDAMGDIENHNQIQFNDRPWIDSPNSWRSLCIVTQSDYRELSRNADICNLLER